MKRIMIKSGITMAMAMVMIFKFFGVTAQACAVTFGEEKLPQKLMD